MVWPTLGSRTAKEQNRNGTSWVYTSILHFFLSMCSADCTVFTCMFSLLDRCIINRRSQALGLTSFAGRIGNMLAPFTSFVVICRFYRAQLCIRGTCHRPVSVCPSVCPSQVGVLLKRINIGSQKQHLTIAQGLQFSDAKDLSEIRPGSPPTGAPNAGGVSQNRRLSTNNRLYLENGTRQTHGFY